MKNISRMVLLIAMAITAITAASFNHHRVNETSQQDWEKTVMQESVPLFITDSIFNYH